MLRRMLLGTAISVSLSLIPGLTFAQSMSSTAAERAIPYSKRPEVARFIQDVSKRRGLPEEWVVEVLDQATYQPKIERLMSPRTKLPPGEKSLMKDWERYRAMFLGEHRLKTGTNFWKENQQWLDKAKEIYGVDPAVIVAIVGVETAYGENKGSWKVLDALVTLSFDYKRRADFFKKELEEFLVMLNKNNLHPGEVVGSFAGAVGLPQFMPSSIRHYGVDFDGDGKIDLTNSIPDTIGSIANYLSKANWQQGLPMLIEAEITPEHNRRFGGGVLPKYTLKSLEDNGVKPTVKERSYPESIKAWVVDFPYYIPGTMKVDRFYRVGTRNFSSVLRYNNSYFYAGAVAELATAIASRMNEPGLIEGSLLLIPKHQNTQVASVNPSETKHVAQSKAAKAKATPTKTHKNTRKATEPASPPKEKQPEPEAYQGNVIKETVVPKE
ncbi:MAG: lytic murein transglycosylase B [Burkholderiales bacterium]|nr:lytic murein transglycosylase B [Burkholderiales bacterium]